jgi:hypothetical protein
MQEENGCQHVPEEEEENGQKPVCSRHLLSVGARRPKFKACGLTGCERLSGR